MSDILFNRFDELRQDSSEPFREVRMLKHNFVLSETSIAWNYLNGLHENVSLHKVSAAHPKRKTRYMVDDVWFLQLNILNLFPEQEIGLLLQLLHCYGKLDHPHHRHPDRCWNGAVFLKIGDLIFLFPTPSRGRHETARLFRPLSMNVHMIGIWTGCVPTHSDLTAFYN